MGSQENAKTGVLLNQFKKRPIMSGVLCLCVCAGIGAVVFLGIRAYNGQGQSPPGETDFSGSQAEPTEPPVQQDEVHEAPEEQRVGGLTFYVDSRDGLDTNDGQSESTAWQSIEKLNNTAFLPGDTILLKAGSVWEDTTFKPNGSGTASAPIVVDAYGDISDENNKPLIHANQNVDTTVRGTSGGNASAAIVIKNVAYWEINNLQLTNNGRNLTELASCYGVLITAEDFGTMTHIYIRNLYIHDVYGKIKKSNDEGTGIFFRSIGPKESKLDDLRIEYNHLERVSRNGIGSIYGFDRKDWSAPYSGAHITDHPYRHTNVFIRGNHLEAIAGDGIKAWGCNGALVEYNIVRGAQLGHIIHGYDDFGTATTVGASVGIWPFDSDNTVIQYNEVSGVAGTMDGQAFDIDFFTTNTIIQYNYSHDNMGGFILLCSPGWAQSAGNVVRYNISQNDGSADGWNYHLKGRLIQHGGGNTDTKIYNNTFYIGAEQAGYPLLSIGVWEEGSPMNISYTNNVFIVESAELTGFFEGDQSLFDHITWDSNVFIGAGFSGGDLKDQMPAGQTVYTDVDVSDFFYGAGNAMFGKDTAIAAYTPLPGTVLESGGAIIDEDALVTQYHFGNGKALMPGDGQYPFPLFWFTNYNAGLDFAGNAIAMEQPRGIGAVTAGEAPSRLRAPVITGIEDIGNGVKVSFEGVGEADSYKLIYGKYVGFGHGAAVLTAAGDADHIVVTDFAEADDYFFTLCGISGGIEGFYAPVKRFVVSDVLLDIAFGEREIAVTTYQADQQGGDETPSETTQKGFLETDGSWTLFSLSEAYEAMPLAAWTLDGITENDGRFVAEQTTSMAETGSESWTNYELTATIENIEYLQWGCQTLWVRRTGEGSGFEIVLSESEIQIKKDGNVVKHVANAFPAGARMMFKVIALNKVITVYVKEGDDFIEKIAYTDTGFTNPAGKIGFGTWNAKAAFFDISVVGIQGGVDAYRQTDLSGGRTRLTGYQGGYAFARTGFIITGMGDNGRAGFVMGSYGIYMDGENLIAVSEADDRVLGSATLKAEEGKAYRLAAAYEDGHLWLYVDENNLLTIAVAEAAMLHGGFALDMRNSTVDYTTVYIKRLMEVGAVTALPAVFPAIPETPEPVPLVSAY